MTTGIRCRRPSRTCAPRSPPPTGCCSAPRSTLPGSVKNLLDWTVGGTELTDKPVAWVNAAADARRGAGAHATLATVLGYVQARVIEPACAHVPVARDALTPDGVIADGRTRAAVGAVLRALAAAAG
jgi:NAD(P)H-dependent FMN reductase